ncbi:unnamed protein product [Hydatigera taeniaeformis]|uniref:WWE domain-containing protein n=1 Tax=Hydatigena taeniaeformis TaxID=6205 RepID=A0A0R3WTD8_HYDTA|nr:unnamed protein product [Hydatigera taeniaeformis]
MVNSAIRAFSLPERRFAGASLGDISYDDPHSIKPTSVRWFYKDETSKKWVPFSGYDSLLIEFTYLNLLKTHESVQSVGAVDTFKPLLVREGLYEVDIVANHCYPVYWESPTGPTDILRGTWFKDPGGPNCVPIEDETMLKQLESAYALLSQRLSDTESLPSEVVSPNFDSEDEVGAETASSITSLFSASSKPACKYCFIIAFYLNKRHSDQRLSLYNALDNVFTA